MVLGSRSKSVYSLKDCSLHPVTVHCHHLDRKFQPIRIFDHSFHNIMTTETDFSLSFLRMISHFRNICELDTSIWHWNTNCTIFKTIICKHCSATSCTIFGLTITFDKVNTSYFTDKPLKTCKVSDVKLLSVYIRFL